MGVSAVMDEKISEVTFFFFFLEEQMLIHFAKAKVSRSAFRKAH